MALRKQAINVALNVAAGEIGVKEIGYTNTGKRVREYQAATTLGGTGWSWCAAFIAWIMAAVARSLSLNQFWSNSPDCDEILTFARRRGIVYETPEVGDVGLVMKSQNDATHIFQVEAINGDHLTTIEGNTNNDGSANGDGVYRLTWRKVSQRRADDGPKYLFVRWSLLLPDTDASGETKNDGYLLSFFDQKRGDDFVKINGNLLVMPTIEARAYVPSRVWGERLGYFVYWDKNDQHVYFIDREGKRRDLVGQTAKIDVTGDGVPEVCLRLVDAIKAENLRYSVVEKDGRKFVRVYL